MSKQTIFKTQQPSSEECHDAAIRAILHVVDEALGEGSPLSPLEFSKALDMLVQQGNLRKWWHDKLGFYNKGKLNELAKRLWETQADQPKYNNTMEEFLLHGSSCIRKNYLLKMGLTDQDELSADHLLNETQILANDRTTTEKTRSDVCTGLKFSPDCQKDRPSNLTRRGTRHLYYCDPCLQLLEMVKTGRLHAQQSVGCNNPGAIANCEGHDSNQYELYMVWHLCSACSRHRRREAEIARKRSAEPASRVTSRQVRARTSEVFEPGANVTSSRAVAMQPVELAPPTEVTSRQVKAKRSEPLEPPADVTSRQVRAQILGPAAASRELRDRISVVPDSSSSSFDIASPAQQAEMHRDAALLKVLRANNISDVTMLEKIADMLRLLQANGVSDMSMLEELLRKACQPEASSPACSTTIQNAKRNLASLDHNAGNFAGKELDPKLLNKQLDAISETLRRAVFEFVGAANVNGNRQAELSNAQDNADLFRLYQSVFGMDPEARYQYQNHKLCKIFHVLWAMLGMIVYSVIRSEGVKIQMLDFDFVDGVDPRLEILAKSIEQEGRASIAIFQRANTAWVSNAAFAQGDIVRAAHDKCVHWMKTLRPHLQVVHGQGSEHCLVYPARERAFQTELEKAIFHALLMGAHLRNAGGYDVSWYRSQTDFNPRKMIAEHENNGDKVFMCVFPGLKRTTYGKVEVVCKARVVCTSPVAEPHLPGGSSSLEATNGDDDCITVARKR